MSIVQCATAAAAPSYRCASLHYSSVHIPFTPRCHLLLLLLLQGDVMDVAALDAVLASKQHTVRQRGDAFVVLDTSCSSFITWRAYFLTAGPMLRPAICCAGRDPLCSSEGSWRVGREAAG